MAKFKQVTITGPAHKLSLVRYNIVELPTISETLEFEDGDDAETVVDRSFEQLLALQELMYERTIVEHLRLLSREAMDPAATDARKMLERRSAEQARRRETAAPNLRHPAGRRFSR